MECRRCGAEIEPARHPVLGPIYVDLSLPTEMHISERTQCGPETGFLILHEPATNA